MTDRRFTDKPDLDPTAVRSLPDGHPALVENRTLFPTTVVTVDENFEGNLLVSGRENRKLGETIAKGKFKGYALYGLSLEERATCPIDCSVRAFCYGNGMQLARRHRIEDFGFFSLVLENEIREIIEEHPTGLMVRLHVLGDFPSIEYISMWDDLLEAHPKLVCYGYTHRRANDDIGKALQQVKDRFGDRFRIRWSTAGSVQDGATIIQRVPLTPRVAEGLVCPAQTDATACCASCGLCWEPSAKKETIVFIKHGPKSLQTAAEAERDGDAGDTRRVQPIALSSGMKPNAVSEVLPQMRMVKPQDLRIEAAYQRDLSGRSVKLIRKIVTGWDWAKFKPPICAETPDGLVVIDGQHTAIAAATHPGITQIPVMVGAVSHLERRASAFVSHNRDRLTMTPAQIFYGEVAAKQGEPRLILERVARAGGSIPKLQVQRGAAKPGQITAVGELRAIFKAAGPTVFERIIRIAVASKIAPISQTPLRAIQMILCEPAFADIAKKGDDAIAAALGSIENLEGACQFYAAETGQGRYRACVGLIAKAAEIKVAA